MNYVSSAENKIELIRKQFSPLVGGKIEGYELAQLWCEEDQEWSDWMDVPLFLTIKGITVSISWQKLDELAIGPGRNLPFSLGGCTVRWICEGIETIDSILGEKIASISLGKGEMSIEGNEVEIWTRLLINFTNGKTFEVFNALDENGIALHDNEITKDVKKCI